MADLDEELQAEAERRRAELERQQQEERLRRQQQVKALAREVIKKEAGALAKKAVKKAAVAGVRAGGAALSSALAVAAPYIIPVLAVILIIGLIIITVVVVITALCNAEGLTGTLATVGSTVTGWFSGADFCKAFSGFKGLVTILDRTQIGGPPAGASCPANLPKPPRVTRVECIDCLDLRLTSIPVKLENTNSLATRVMAQKLQSLASRNSTFRVTEGFCPTIGHSSPSHYNGFAVDINLKPGFKGDRQKLVQLFRDAQAIGFDVILCEYPAGFLRDFDIQCSERATTDAGHIHLEISGPDFFQT